MDINFIMNLMEEVKAFESAKQYKSTPTIDDFRGWLNEKSYLRESPVTLLETQPQPVYDLENEICKQLLLLGRFSKQIIRKGLTDFPQLANEEFTYLYRLMGEDGLTKMQLIEKNAHEKQTGIEIIKRLVNHEYITELPCVDDKRRTRLSVTPLGKQTFEASIPNVTLTALVLSGHLNADEKQSLLDHLKKLNAFHFTLYHTQKSSRIEDIALMLMPI